MMQHLIEAAKEIAYDNGAINRISTEDEVVNKMLTAVKGLFNENELNDVENFLAHLSKEDFMELCTGEQGAILATELVEEVLECMFDNM